MLKTILSSLQRTGKNVQGEPYAQITDLNRNTFLPYVWWLGWIAGYGAESLVVDVETNRSTRAGNCAVRPTAGPTDSWLTTSDGVSRVLTVTADTCRDQCRTCVAVARTTQRHVNHPVTWIYADAGRQNSLLCTSLYTYTKSVFVTDYCRTKTEYCSVLIYRMLHKSKPPKFRIS